MAWKLKQCGNSKSVPIYLNLLYLIFLKNVLSVQCCDKVFAEKVAAFLLSSMLFSFLKLFSIWYTQKQKEYFFTALYSLKSEQMVQVEFLCLSCESFSHDSCSGSQDWLFTIVLMNILPKGFSLYFLHLAYHFDHEVTSLNFPLAQCNKSLFTQTFPTVPSSPTANLDLFHCVHLFNVEDVNAYPREQCTPILSIHFCLSVLFQSAAIRCRQS